MNILKKLTLKNLRKNKTRTIVTIAGIALSIALVTIIAGVAASGRASSLKAVETLTGDYTFAIGGDFDNTQIEKVRSNRSVRDVYYYGFIGTSPFEDSNSKYRPYLLTMSIDSKTLNDNSIRLKEGRYAEKDDEIVLSADFVNYSSKTYKVGDKLTLKTGERYYSETGKKELQVTPEYADQPLHYIFPYLFENEEFRQTGTKTYTIVGITDTEGGFFDNNNNLGTGTNVRLYTYSPDCKTEALYIRLKDECEADCVNVVSQITGIDTYLLNANNNGTLSDTAYEEFCKQGMSGDVKVVNIIFNHSLLNEKGISVTGGAINNIDPFLVAGFIIVIVIIASVFIIRNSFAISLTEKTKLYGMLSSTGATPRQIRNCVFFEALILGLIGIPIGIGIGAGGTWVLISLVGTILKDQLGSMTMVFDMTWMTVITAVVLGALTIFLSSLSSAVRAQRIPPIEAIRSSKDIKVGRVKSERSYKTPNLIKKLFGAGGSIAWKNMKRSRKQYRTTVISIIVSVSVFLTVYSFVDYGIKSIESEEYYKNSIYNMSMYLSTTGDDNKAYSVKELIEKYDKLANSDGIKKYRYYIDSFGYEMEMDKKCITNEYISYVQKYSSETIADVPDKFPVSVTFMAVDDNEFRHICDETGNDYDKCKDKGFISGNVGVYIYGVRGYKPIKMLSNSIKGKTISAAAEVYIYNDDENSEKPEYDEDYYEEPETEIVKASIEIADLLPDDYNPDVFSTPTNPIIITTFDRFGRFDRMMENSGSAAMLVDAENPDELEERANDGKLSSEIGIYGVTNYSKMINNMRSLILVVEIFVYGFIAVITLIGVTNIFNTITTNMKLRRKEFAMLQSIGTTHKEFNRMIRLESLLYTFKSLIIGIPIGLAGSTAVYFLFSQNTGYEFVYSFPLMAVLISILAVLIILWMIMRFSISKLKKQNIIETIRNDNI